MPSTYQQNLLALKQKNPELATFIDKLKDDGTVTVKKELTSKFPYVIVRDADGKEWQIHDKHHPVEEGRAFANAEIGTVVDRAHIIVVFGLGLGYEFEALFNRFMGPQTQFIVIENNAQLFKKFMQSKCVNYGNAHGGVVGNILNCPAVNFLVGMPLDDMYNVLFDIMHHSSGSVFTTFYCIEHPILIRFNKPYYKPIIEILARVCYDIKSSFGNDPEDSWLGMDHMLQNTDLIAQSPGITPLKDQFKDVPAMIVATGPSLNKNIHLLKDMAKSCVFFAADASINTFMKYEENGVNKPIIPHIVTSLERSPTTHRHFKQVPKEKWEHLKDTYLCACPVVRPDVYEHWHGKKVMMYRDFAHFRWLHLDKGSLNTGKSVTNLAWKVAEYMGCNPIILVGQDLAFSRDGSTHAKGADHAREGLKKSPLIKSRMKCMGYDGKEIETLDTWYGMKKRFEYDIARNPKVMCINATEGGAKIDGTYQLPLKECLDLLSDELDIKKRLDELLVPPTKDQVEKDTETISFHIDSGYKYLHRSIEILDKIIKTIDNTMGRYCAEEICDGEYDAIINSIESMKADLLRGEYAWFTMMHVMQSWMMGRDNILRSIPSIYSGSEAKAVRLLRLYEFFRGLKILYELVYNGTKEMYYDRGKKMPEM